MSPFHLLPVRGTLFFSVWTALLARLKGYSALRWHFAAGPVGVLVLLRLRPASQLEDAQRKKNDRIGLALSTFTVLAACACEEFL
jgi:hypothetical protein